MKSSSSNRSKFRLTEVSNINDACHKSHVSPRTDKAREGNGKGNVKGKWYVAQTKS